MTASCLIHTMAKYTLHVYKKNELVMATYWFIRPYNEQFG